MCKIDKDFCGQFGGSASLGERGQIVIPKKIRESMKLKKGDHFFVIQKHGVIVLAPDHMMENFISHVTKEIKKINKQVNKK